MWKICSICKQTIHISSMNGFIKEHECPERPAQDFNAEMDAIVSFEMDDFDNLVAGFWCEPDVKFMEHLAKNGDI